MFATHQYILEGTACRAPTICHILFSNWYNYSGFHMVRYSNKRINADKFVPQQIKKCYKGLPTKKYSIPAGRYANALSAEEAEEKESAAMKMG